MRYKKTEDVIKRKKKIVSLNCTKIRNPTSGLLYIINYPKLSPTFCEDDILSLVQDGRKS
jgi:hypothetical protein